MSLFLILLLAGFVATIVAIVVKDRFFTQKPPTRIIQPVIRRDAVQGGGPGRNPAPPTPAFLYKETTTTKVTTPVEKKSVRKRRRQVQKAKAPAKPTKAVRRSTRENSVDTGDTLPDVSHFSHIDSLLIKQIFALGKLIRAPKLFSVARAARAAFNVVFRQAQTSEAEVPGLAAFIVKNESVLRTITNHWHTSCWDSPSAGAAVNAVLKGGIPLEVVLEAIDRLNTKSFDLPDEKGNVDPMQLLYENIVTNNGRTAEALVKNYRFAVAAFRVAARGEKRRRLAPAEVDFGAESAPKNRAVS